MVEILALVLHHDEQAVLAAVELALESGAASKTHILNVLHRLLDGKPVQEVCYGDNAHEIILIDHGQGAEFVSAQHLGCPVGRHC